MTNQSAFPVSNKIKNRLRGALRARGHEEAADQLWLQHPPELGAEHITQTGGGCQAYFIKISCSEGNYLVVWTTDDGADLPTETDYRVGVYSGVSITEDPVAMIASETGPEDCDIEADRINDLAQHIRQVNGNNDMGAARLAESILLWLEATGNGQRETAIRSKYEPPKGYRLVPEKLTPEMAEEIKLHDQYTFKALQVRYEALLAAAPQPTEDD